MPKWFQVVYKAGLVIVLFLCWFFLGTVVIIGGIYLVDFLVQIMKIITNN